MCLFSFSQLILVFLSSVLQYCSNASFVFDLPLCLRRSLIEELITNNLSHLLCKSCCFTHFLDTRHDQLCSPHIVILKTNIQNFLKVSVCRIFSLIFKHNPSSRQNVRFQKMDVFLPCKRANGRSVKRVPSGVQWLRQAAVWPRFNGLSSEGPSETTILPAACDLTPAAAQIE